MNAVFLSEFLFLLGLYQNYIIFFLPKWQDKCKIGEYRRYRKDGNELHSRSSEFQPENAIFFISCCSKSTFRRKYHLNRLVLLNLRQFTAKTLSYCSRQYYQAQQQLYSKPRTLLQQSDVQISSIRIRSLRLYQSLLVSLTLRFCVSQIADIRSKCAESLEFICLLSHRQSHFYLLRAHLHIFLLSKGLYEIRKQTGSNRKISDNLHCLNYQCESSLLTPQGCGFALP